MELAFPFLRDAHYCSNRFENVTYMRNDELGVLQEYTIDREALLSRYEKNMRREDDFLAVKSLVQIIIEMYRDNKSISKRLAKQVLICKIDTSFEQRNIHTVCRERLLHARNKITELIPHFPYEKESFLGELENIFESFNLLGQDREELRIFAFQEVVNMHYPDILNIFFDTSLPFIRDDGRNKGKQFLTKRQWLRLKGMQELTVDTIGLEKDEESGKTKNQKYFMHILNFKGLILELANSIVSPILLPIILKLVASAMILDKKEFYKFSYILLFLFANSYENEYIPLSRFLNELEVYINYNNKNRVLEKFKIGFSLVMLFIAFVGVGYFLFPPILYVSGVILMGIYLKMYFIDNYNFSAGIQYNLGMRLWSTLLLGIFGYIWITNIGSYMTYYANLEKKFEGIGSHIMAEIFPPEKIAE